MGALGLEGWGRRPRGKGCLLLAVAGTTSLVTLLLAVPITVLAVLAVVSQKQGGLVTETTDPGARAKAQQRLGSQELSEQEAETDPSLRLPAAHLIGAWTQGQGLGWETEKEEAFLRSGAQFSSTDGLALPRDGLYYLYCQVGYRGRAPPADRDPVDRSVTLRSRLYRARGAYGPHRTPELLLEGVETVSPALDRTRKLWYTSVGVGGLVQLQRGERVYVNISHPDMVDYRRGKTFFGAVMVG
ncbi:lymphotoxin-beta isoform X1 [Artibeus jamaicensis]|uniref:lymphotoxin-beta isoform X1 n=1 Tax=Artibeus jamaicensis TaxID=9417 RepID=UPI00235A4E00|nr:lymphotoxin-beta isoform X1 [Artibeus jamaicensis]